MGCFSGPSIPTPPAPPDFSGFKFPEFPTFGGIEFPAPFDSEAAAAKQRKADEVKALRLIEQKRKGYGSTLLTGGQGDETAPLTAKPGLIGR